MADHTFIPAGSFYEKLYFETLTMTGREQVTEDGGQDLACSLQSASQTTQLSIDGSGAQHDDEERGATQKLAIVTYYIPYYTPMSLHDVGRAQFGFILK